MMPFDREEPWNADGEVDVFHWTQVVEELVEDGRLDLSGDELDYTVTYHDPCHLGRYNDEYEAPRELIRATGADLHEMPRARRFLLLWRRRRWPVDRTRGDGQAERGAPPGGGRGHRRGRRHREVRRRLSDVYDDVRRRAEDGRLRRCRGDRRRGGAVDRGGGDGVVAGSSWIVAGSKRITGPAQASESAVDADRSVASTESSTRRSSSRPGARSSHGWVIARSSHGGA